MTGGEDYRAAVAAVDEARLMETAVDLVAAPSPTRSAGEAADRLDRRLRADGFQVERPEADWPESPAVVARLDSGAPGRWLQFNGHLDTVHLPFEPPAVRDGVLTGSGSSDMKGGIAAAVEAMRALRDSGLPRAGGILLTAHDHHEAPWGDGRQLRALIREGYVGDGVLLPEYLADRLPGAGRGMGVFDIRLTRPGEAVHEVLRPPETPDVVAAGAALVGELKDLDVRLTATRHEVSGRDSVFVGQLESGEIFNQAPVSCRLRGTRRWVTQGRGEEAREELTALAGSVASRFGAEAGWSSRSWGRPSSCAGRTRSWRPSRRRWRPTTAPPCPGRTSPSSTTATASAPRPGSPPSPTVRRRPAPTPPRSGSRWPSWCGWRGSTRPRP